MSTVSTVSVVVMGHVNKSAGPWKAVREGSEKEGDNNNGDDEWASVQIVQRVARPSGWMGHWT